MHAYQGLVAQCYGENTLTTVFRKSVDNAFPVPGDVLPGTGPTSPTDPDWHVQPGATPPSGGGGSGTGGGAGGGAGGGGASGEPSELLISSPDTTGYGPGYFGVLSPGESRQLVLTVENVGGSTAIIYDVTQTAYGDEAMTPDDPHFVSTTCPLSPEATPTAATPKGFYLTETVGTTGPFLLPAGASCTVTVELSYPGAWPGYTRWHSCLNFEPNTCAGKSSGTGVPFEVDYDQGMTYIDTWGFQLYAP